MTTETDTLPGGDGQQPVAQTTDTAATAASARAPRSDAEAEQQEAAAQAAKEPGEQQQPESEADKDGEQKRNRTRRYIEKLNGENRTHRENWNSPEALRARLAQFDQQQNQIPSRGAPVPQSGQDAEPTLEGCEFDVARFAREHSRWAVRQELAERDQQQSSRQDQERQQQAADAYNQRIADFAEDHPDFAEVVGSIAYVPNPEVQQAIMAHERGAEIAYYLGNNDDEAFNMASIPPHLAAAAVERLVGRMSAAPTPAPAAVAAPAAAPAPTPKPITQAPPPAPRVSGRAPTEAPPEKLTDDEWYAKDRERRRKR